MISNSITNITVSRAQGAQLERVIELDQLFPHPWPAAAWKELTPHMHCFVLKNDEIIIGYALFQYVSGQDQAHLLKIYVSGESRQQGLAQQLFNQAYLELGASQVFLEVAESNVAALRFYEKIGFNRVHLAKNFYSDGENAWLMLLAH